MKFTILDRPCANTESRVSRNQPLTHTVNFQKKKNNVTCAQTTKTQQCQSVTVSWIFTKNSKNLKTNEATSVIHFTLPTRLQQCVRPKMLFTLQMELVIFKSPNIPENLESPESYHFCFTSLLQLAMFLQNWDELLYLHFWRFVSGFGRMHLLCSFEISNYKFWNFEWQVSNFDFEISIGAYDMLIVITVTWNTKLIIKCSCSVV